MTHFVVGKMAVCVATSDVNMISLMTCPEDCIWNCLCICNVMGVYIIGMKMFSEYPLPSSHL